MKPFETSDDRYLVFKIKKEKGKYRFLGAKNALSSKCWFQAEIQRDNSITLSFAEFYTLFLRAVKLQPKYGRNIESSRFYVPKKWHTNVQFKKCAGHDDVPQMIVVLDVKNNYCFGPLRWHRHFFGTKPPQITSHSKLLRVKVQIIVSQMSKCLKTWIWNQK